VTIGDLIRDGKLLEVHCASCRPEPSLHRPRKPRVAQAHAGAAGGQTFGLLEVWGEEYGDL